MMETRMLLDALGCGMSAISKRTIVERTGVFAVEPKPKPN